MTTASTPSAPQRGPERRAANLGAPGGNERRALADRRGENNRQYVHFRVGTLDFLLRIDQVQEVVLAAPPTPVPLAPALVAGLINLRGQILPAIDLATALDEPGAVHEAGLNVVVRAEGGAFAVRADEVFDVLEASPTMLVPPPLNLRGPVRTLTQSVCKVAGRLLLVMDLAGLGQLVEAAPATPR